MFTIFHSATGYLVIVGDLARPIAQSFGLAETILANEYFLISMLGVLVILPLSLLRHFSFLRYTSYLSIAGVFAFAVAAIVFTIKTPRVSFVVPAKLDASLFLTAPMFVSRVGSGSLLICLSSFIFAFACHTNLLNGTRVSAIHRRISDILPPPAYAEVVDSRKPKMNFVIHGSVGIVFAAYIIVGQLGYITFGEETRHNIFMNYPLNDWLITVSRFAMILSVVLTYPMASYPARHSIFMLYKLARVGFDEIRSEKPDRLINALIVIPFFGFTLTIALLAKDVVAVFGLTGATASTAACFVGPPLINMMLRRNVNGTPLLSRANVLHWLLLVMGSIVGAISFIVLLIDLANPSFGEQADAGAPIDLSPQSLG